MKSYNYLKPILLGLLFMGIGKVCLADYATNMKERLSSLIEAKDQGLVGEGTDGFVYVRNSDSAQDLAGSYSEKVNKMVSDENEDRKLLFKSMSLKTGGTIDDIAKKFSMAIVKKSKKGHWFRKSSGDWMQRK